MIVTGIARVPENIECEKLPVQFLPEIDDIEQSMSTADIYKELRIRGYQYTDSFRLLKSASINGRVGRIKLSIYWAAFIDNMLQMRILSYDSRSMYVPTQILKLVIDPVSHMKQIQELSTQEKGKRIYALFRIVHISYFLS